MYFWERRKEIRDSDEKSAGCGILVVKEWECGIRTPPSRPCWKSSHKKPQEVTNVTASRKKAQEVLRVQPKKLVVLVLVWGNLQK